MNKQELISIRRQIDLIDWKIILLLEERMEIALKSRKFKEQVFDAEREMEVLENVRRFSHNLIRPEFPECLYTLILKESKSIQEMDLKLMGFQGEHGAYSEAASLQYAASFVPIPCREFKDIFDDVEAGILDCCIVPVENSIEGALTQVNDLLIERNLKIIGEVIIPIHHCLLALPHIDYRDLKVVYSHPQALCQCRNFILRHGFKPRPFYDTAGAARMLSEDRPEAACVIGNRLSAQLYHLEILKENIEDYPLNSTRFIILSREASAEPGDKCSIIFSVRHEAGSLFNLLKVFSEANINLTRIESRPAKDSPGHYVVFTDFEGSDRDKKVLDAIEKVKDRTLSFKFLGCYRAARREVAL